MCQDIVTTVVTRLRENSMLLIDQRGFSVTNCATQSFVKQNSPLRNNLLIGEYARRENLGGYTQHDIEKATPKEFRISKPGDMQDNEMQKDSTLLRNGKNSNENSAINVLFVEPKSLLQKTISFHYRKAAQILSQISSPFAVIATVKSGETTPDYFNIYEERNGT